MAKQAHAHGILLVRRRNGKFEIFLGQSGHPRYWGKEHARVWGLPKGRAEAGETSLQAALREYQEEVGAAAPAVPYNLFCVLRTRKRKSLTVHTADVTTLPEVVYGGSTVCHKKWRGKNVTFLEFTDAGWFTLKQADKLILRSQRNLLRIVKLAARQQRTHH